MNLLAYLLLRKLCPIFATTSIESMLRDVFNSTVCVAAFSHNARQPGANLPAEVLAETLLLLPVADRVVASSVCKHWNRVIRSSPHLWTSIEFNGFMSDDQSINLASQTESVRAMLDLSGRSLSTFQSNFRPTSTVLTSPPFCRRR